jgi:hypothetical protein
MRGRVTRAMKQRMFVMSRELANSNDSIEKFEVLGSIGNVSIYNVMFSFIIITYTFAELHCVNPIKDEMYLYGLCHKKNSLQAYLNGLTQSVPSSL